MADETHTGVLVLSEAALRAGHEVPAPEALQAEDLEALLDPQPEVLVIGTGDRMVPLPDAIAVPLQVRGIGLEVMPTDAACRTFNILLGEGRDVIALLYPVTS